MDFLITQNIGLLRTWSIEKRAEIPGGLPDRLSIKEISQLSAQQDIQKQSVIVKAIIKLCKEKSIECYGNIEGWEYQNSQFNYIANPYPDITGTQVDMGDLMRTALAGKWKASPTDCLIDRREFQRYLQSVNQIASGFIAKWLQNTEVEVEAVGDAVTGNHAGTALKEKEVIAWLRETWINEGEPGGTAFFNKLKKYVNKKGSPIVEHYSAGKDAGFRWETSAGTTGRMARKTISNKVSIFNNKP